jgi:hypothetical protein
VDELLLDELPVLPLDELPVALPLDELLPVLPLDELLLPSSQRTHA